MGGLLGATTQTGYYDSESNSGGYQFTSLNDIINQFIIAYVGEGKIISKIKRPDVVFHAKRAMQELSFDTFKSIKSQELEIPPSLKVMLPQDYVNYTNISWSDGSGIQHTIYPAIKTSNPIAPIQNSDGDFKFEVTATLTDGSDQVVLDKEYSNIYPGLIVVSPHIPTDRRVINNVQSDGTNTTLELASSSQQGATSIFTAEFDDDITVEIRKPDGSLFLKQGVDSYTARDLALPTAGDNFITVSSTDANNIKVGMLATSSIMYTDVDPAKGVPENTFVVAVDGTKVTLSNPLGEFPIAQSLNDWNFISQDSQSDTWGSYKSNTPSENNNGDYEDDTYWPTLGERYGLDPQYAQTNGSFFIEDGMIHFSSNISGKTVILKYISDSLGTDAEMQVHKFAEEAVYKWIAYAILSTRINTPEYIINRFKKERFAEIRKAKLRLSNIKLEELTQILRGKSKQIKH